MSNNHRHFSVSDIFGSDGRVRVGMGLKRVVSQDRQRKLEQQRRNDAYLRHREGRLVETYCRFILRGVYKYSV